MCKQLLALRATLLHFSAPAEFMCKRGFTGARKVFGSLRYGQYITVKYRISVPYFF